MWSKAGSSFSWIYLKYMFMYCTVWPKYLSQSVTFPFDHFSYTSCLFPPSLSPSLWIFVLCSPKWITPHTQVWATPAETHTWLRGMKGSIILRLGVDGPRPSLPGGPPSGDCWCPDLGCWSLWDWVMWTLWMCVWWISCCRTFSDSGSFKEHLLNHECVRHSPSADWLKKVQLGWRHNAGHWPASLHEDM